MKKRILAALLAFALLLPVVGMGEYVYQREEAYHTATRFLDALRECNYAWAANLCLDGDAPLAWDPPASMKYVFYPLIRDITVQESRVDDATGLTIVTLSMTAPDFASEEVLEELQGTLLEEDGMYQVGLSDYAIKEMFFGAEELKQALAEHRRAYAMPCAIRDIDGREWRIDLAETLALWETEPLPEILPDSYDVYAPDAVLTRFQAQNALYAGKLPYPDESVDFYHWLYSVDYADVRAALGLPKENVWLRLRADQPYEALYDFALSGGAWASPLIRYYDYASLYPKSDAWVEFGGAWRAFLTASVPAGTSLDQYTLLCRERVNVGLPTYYEREVQIPLAGVALDDLTDDVQASFTVEHFMRIRNQEHWDGQPVEMLSELLTEENVWLSLPEDIENLPLDNDRYALYRLQGTMRKAPGDYGVYDVTYTTDAEGVWTMLFERCSDCAESVGAGLMGLGAQMYNDSLQSPFEAYVLMQVGGRTDAELDAALRALAITAHYSAEQIDFCYEQHGTTVCDGPRGHVALDLSRMERWDGAEEDLPRAEVVRVELDSEDDGNG